MKVSGNVLFLRMSFRSYPLSNPVVFWFVEAIAFLKFYSSTVKL